MFKNSNIASYYNSKIDGFKHKVLKGNLPQREKERFFEYLKKIYKLINSNLPAKQFNQILDKMERLYGQIQGEYITKLNTLNSFFKNHGCFPLCTDKISTFQDGTIMSEFILDNVDYLKEMYAKSPVLEYALRSYEAVNKNKLVSGVKKAWPFEVKIRFVFRYLSEYKCLPMEYSLNFRFPDGKKFTEWFQENEEEIRNNLDYRAMVIWSYYTYYSDLDFRDKLIFVYDYLMKHGNQSELLDNDAKFSDGVLVRDWIHYHSQDVNNLKNIVKEASVIAEYLDFVKAQGVYDLDFYEQLIEVYRYLKVHGHLPKFDNSMVKLKNGDLMGKWILANKQKLLELDDDYAGEIARYLGVRRIKKDDRSKDNSSFDKKKQAIYDYLMENGVLPKATDKTLKFDDGTLMCFWVFNHRGQLYELKDSDSKARAIVNYLETRESKGRGRRKNGLTFDERVKEVYEYLEEYGNLPRYSDDTVRFSDQVLMGRWIKRNRNKIQEMVQDDRGTMIIQYLDKFKLYRNGSKGALAVFDLNHGKVPKDDGTLKKYKK